VKTTRKQNLVGCDTASRREFLAGSVAAGAAILLCGELTTGAGEKKTFTILHTSDLHSNFIGMSPASDYSPFSVGDGKTLGDYARLATLIHQRKQARQNLGPVLILDEGDYN